LLETIQSRVHDSPEKRRFQGVKNLWKRKVSSQQWEWGGLGSSGWW